MAPAEVPTMRTLDTLDETTPEVAATTVGGGPGPGIERGAGAGTGEVGAGTGAAGGGRGQEKKWLRREREVGRGTDGGGRDLGETRGGREVARLRGVEMERRSRVRAMADLTQSREEKMID